jgi:hypothetical protein
MKQRLVVTTPEADQDAKQIDRWWKPRWNQAT